MVQHWDTPPDGADYWELIDEFENDIMEYDSKRSQRIRESQGEEDEGQDD